MDIITALSLSQKLQISQDYIMREEYEILWLKEIFESKFGSSLVFKGGTALRLAYGSPRFSEDLDFTLMREINRSEFMNFIREVGKKYPAVFGVETREKFYTVFALVKIKEEYQDRSFSIKIEVSKRQGSWKKEKDLSQKIIRSEVTPLTVLANVASLERLLEEKKDAIRNRKAARDLFDLWYINQLLKIQIKPDFTGFDKKQTKSELHRLLPRNYWRLVDSWLG